MADSRVIKSFSLFESDLDAFSEACALFKSRFCGDVSESMVFRAAIYHYLDSMKVSDDVLIF